MPTIFLAVTGTQGSGKTIFTETVKGKYKIPTYRLGKIVVDECQKRGLELNSQNMGNIASILRNEYGDQSIVQRALPEIKEMAKANPEFFLIDGVRSFPELTLLREELGDVILVAIIASLRIRKQRVEARKRIDHENSSDFEEREQRELGFGLGNVITKADYYILNDDLTKNEFKRQIKLLLTRIQDESEK
jgi:dephospho-CoA kinase